MSVDVDGLCDVWRQQIVRARKEHECAACHEKILKGHRYLRHFSVYEGEPETVARCLRCEAIYVHLCDRLDPFEEKPDETLNCGHTYEERWNEHPSEEIAALAFMTQEEMQNKVDRQQDKAETKS